MNFTQLRCFIYVADNLSFTTAARKLNFSQSAISKNLNDLEKELKTRLLVRNPHKIALTLDGEYFYQVAVNILKEKDNAILNITKSHQKELFGNVNIGLDYSPFERSFLPTLIRQCKPTSFVFTVNYLGDYVSQLTDGKVDIAILSDDIIKSASGLNFVSLISGEFVLMYNANANFDFGKKVSITELKNTCVLVPFTDRSYPSIYHLNQVLCQKLNAENIKTVDNYFLMYDYISASVNQVAIMPNFVVDLNKKGFKYSYLNYSDPFSYGVAYPMHKENDTLFQRIIAILKEIVPTNILPK